MTPDVNIVLLNLPVKEKEAITENEDGSYTVIINARLSYERQMIAYKHAMKHIENADFQKNDVQTVEAVAHDIKIAVESQPIPSGKFLQRLKRLRADRKRIQRELQQFEEDMEIIRSMRGYSDFELPDSQQWYGKNL